MKKIIFLVLFIAVFGLTACSKKTDVGGVGINKTEESKKVENININEIVAGDYLINTEKSELLWTAGKIIGSSHTGNIKIKNGKININGDQMVGGSFIVDMKTISDKDNNERLVKHLSGEDFFDVEKFPESSFVITKLIKKENGLYTVEGDLTIKDITKSIMFDIFVKIENGLFLGNAEISIDRTRWNIKYGSGKFFKELGDKAIKDEINYVLKIEAALE